MMFVRFSKKYFFTCLLLFGVVAVSGLSDVYGAALKDMRNQLAATKIMNALQVKKRKKGKPNRSGVQYNNYLFKEMIAAIPSWKGNSNTVSVDVRISGKSKETKSLKMSLFATTLETFLNAQKKDTKMYFRNDFHAFLLDALKPNPVSEKLSGLKKKLVGLRASLVMLTGKLKTLYERLSGTDGVKGKLDVLKGKVASGSTG